MKRRKPARPHSAELLLQVAVEPQCRSRIAMGQRLHANFVVNAADAVDVANRLLRQLLLIVRIDNAGEHDIFAVEFDTECAAEEVGSASECRADTRGKIELGPGGRLHGHHNPSEVK